MSSSSSSAAGQEAGQIDVSTLNIQQLAQLQKTLELDSQELNTYFKTLKTARDRFTTSDNALAQLENAKDGHSVMVPLTSSLYVPGKLSNPDTVLVDIGTGYYVKKGNKAARDTLKRRKDVVTGSLTQIQEKATQKRRELEVVNAYLQSRLQQQQQQQQQVAASSK